MTKAMLLIAMFILAACGRSDDYAKADNRVLWDKEGCAFITSVGSGDISFIRRLKDSDKEGCLLP